MTLDIKDFYLGTPMDSPEFNGTTNLATLLTQQQKYLLALFLTTLPSLPLTSMKTDLY